MAFNIPLSSLSPSDGNVTYAANTLLKVGGPGNITVSSALIESGGLVGVGSSSPGYTVDVTGNLRVSSGATISNLSITNTTASTSSTTGALTVAGGVGVIGNLNVGNTTIISGILNINYTGNTDSSITITGNNTKGGAGYQDFLRVTNTGQTNPNKWFRLNSSGNLEILRSDYGAVILSLSDSGIMSLGGAATSSNDPVTNYLSFNSANTVIYDDGNTHFHSRINNGALWINTNGGQINMISQVPVSGGSVGTGVGIGTSSLTGFVTIIGTKSWTTSASYGYLYNSAYPIGQYTGGSQTISNLSLYANGRIMANEMDALSDERAKNILGTIKLEDALTFIRAVDGIIYTWRTEAVDFEEPGIKSGFSAQSIHKAGFGHMISMLPNEKLAASTDQDGWTSPENTQMSLNYNQTIPYHHVVIKNLLDRIIKLETKLSELTSKNII
jgi:hypothetical protein